MGAARELPAVIVMPDTGGMPPDSPLTFIEVSQYVRDTVARVEAAVIDVRDALDEHETWHRDEMRQALTDARRVPGRVTAAVTAVIAAVAALFAAWAAFHPAPVHVISNPGVSVVTR